MSEAPYGPITIEVPLEELRQVLKSLRECGEDVIANADAQYPEDTRSKYPTEQRRYERDREAGDRAIYLATVIMSWPGFTES